MPDKPVELIVTCQPGCGPDIAARLIQRIWQEHRIVPVPSVVVNKAGGGGAVAYSYLNQKPGDGHALVLSGAGAVVNSIMGRGVGYKDLTALLGGHVQVVPASVGLWAGPLKAGQVRLIAVSAPQRLRGELAQVPTWREQNVDAVVSVWRMITAPPGLTPAQVAFWRDALRRTTETAEWKRDLEVNYQSDEFMAGPELDRALDSLYMQLKGLLTELDLAKKP